MNLNINFHFLQCVKYDKYDNLKYIYSTPNSSNKIIKLIRVNEIIKNKRLLQYTCGIFHIIPLLYNIKYNKCKIWQLLQSLIILTSFGYHRYKNKKWLIFDRIMIICNCYIILTLLFINSVFLNTYKIKLNILDTIIFMICFLFPIFAYMYGYKQNILCFDKRFGYLIHMVCHLLTAISFFIILKNI